MINILHEIWHFGSSALQIVAFFAGIVLVSRLIKGEEE